MQFGGRGSFQLSINTFLFLLQDFKMTNVFLKEQISDGQTYQAQVGDLE